MAGSKILIVEDDGIIGHHIQSILTKLGYQIAGIASSGSEALTMAEQTVPDLVLMDISLEGDMDGVDVAEQIHRKSDTPIIYLTAYSDEKTLRRAKISDPFGYILKPFDERTLHASIIMALHKHDLELVLKENEARYRTLVQNQGEGLVIVDPNEVFKFANPAADEIFGLPVGGLTGHNLQEFTSPQQYDHVIEQTQLRSRGEKNSYEIQIRRSDGEIRHLIIVATPWFEKEIGFVGTCAIMRDVTEQKRMAEQERDQRNLAETLRETTSLITSTLDLNEVLNHILSSIGKVVPHEAAVIILMDDDIGHIVGANGFFGSSTLEQLQAERFDIHDMPALRHIINTSQPILINNTENAEEWVNYPAYDWIKSVLGAPISVRQENIGALLLMSTSAGFFNSQHLDRLVTFANQAAIAIENAELYHEAKDRANYLELINQLTDIAIHAKTFHEMLEKFGEQIGKVFKADGVYFTLWDPESAGTIQGAAFGLNSDNYPRSTGKPGEHTLTASVLQLMKPIAVDDVHNTPYIDPDVAADFPVTSLLGLPLVADGQKLGAMLIGYQNPHVFRHREVERAEQIALQVALAMIKGLLFEQERDRTRQLSRANELITALAHVSARIEKIPAPQYVMETLVEELKHMGIFTAISLFDEVTGKFHVRYTNLTLDRIHQDSELSQYSLDTIQEIFDSSPFFENVISKRKAHFVPNVREVVLQLSSQKYPLPLIERLQELVGINDHIPVLFLPLNIGEREIGRLWLWGENLEKNDLNAHSVFASQVAIALENARLYAEVQNLAMTDELTGLYNRRRLFQIALDEITRARNLGIPFSLIIVDLDEFKLINDTYGHVIGDEVVVEIADRCRQHARKSDLLGRYGGDEFIILLPGTDLKSAMMVAERMRAIIQDEPIKTTGGEVVITASMGVGTMTEDTTDLVSLLIRADKSLYTAKQSGRNQVIAQ